MAAPGSIALPIERDFMPNATVDFAANNWPLAIGIVCAYLSFITGGSIIMSRMEKPFDLRMPLACWNALLCVFSFIGMCKTMPYLIGSLLTQPFDQTVCTAPADSWGVGPTGFWVMLFVYSKVPELMDTVFITLRKRPLIFLHWYHHVTVLLFCWSAYSTMAGSGLYFVAMNYSVHALMYGYYCLQALRMLPKSFPAVIITISQIAQMFVGTGVCCACWYYSLTGKSCHNETSNLVAGALMYGSYLYLFCDFAVRRYVFPKAKLGKKIE
ncbi:putative elongation of very long chain fatty acids protein [Ochromonadaceae sp. CCMP2298]|nr:putative elongation of very long chain fatty acids protein [Ochromonadaceae sp. CCMP2298]